MPRRKDSFARALADAQKRLEKAQAERTATQDRLAELEHDIPHLKSIIVALQQNPDKPIDFQELERLWKVASEGHEPVAPPPVPERPIVPMTPDEVKKLAAKATGPIRGGSIPYGGVKPPAPPVSEEEMLPNPEGEEIID